MIMAADQDVFEDVLNLEDRYYQEGYDLGVADGSKSGRIEGRIFGLEKGFEKFVEMGKLHGIAAVWEARLLASQADEHSATDANQTLPALGNNQRLTKHVQRLAALSDPNDLSTDNTEDAVSEFDDRLKDARAKETLIARIVGEDEHALLADNERGASAAGEEGAPLRVRRNDASGAPRRTGEMEDFVGLPQVGR